MGCHFWQLGHHKAGNHSCSSPAGRTRNSLASPVLCLTKVVSGRSSSWTFDEEQPEHMAASMKHRIIQEIDDCLKYLIIAILSQTRVHKIELYYHSPEGHTSTWASEGTTTQHDEFIQGTNWP
jgi:hypothetical protein